MTKKFILHITLLGSIDSKELYEKLKQFELNVTDFQDKTYVYGHIELYMLGTISSICWDYAKGQIEISMSAKR